MKVPHSFSVFSLKNPADRLSAGILFVNQNTTKEQQQKSQNIHQFINQNTSIYTMDNKKGYIFL
jgi:hypothetical protein